MEESTFKESSSLPRNLKVALLRPETFLLIICTWCVIFMSINIGDVIDDAYISFRYARNLVEGKGLIFNVGEIVEGYTNFLWVIIISLFIKLGFDPGYISQVLGIIFNACTILITYKLGELITGERNHWNLISTALLAINVPFIVWAIEGMETSLFTFLVVFSIYLYIREDKKDGYSFPFSAIICALAAMTRPDGILVFVTLFIYKISTILTRKDKLNKRDIIFPLVFIIVYGTYFLWRYSYYGYLLPNTFYAKARRGFDIEIYKQGWTYIYKYFTTGKIYRTSPWEWKLIILSLVLVLRRWRKYYSIIIVFIGLYSLFIIYAGGDWMADFRFLVPIIPLICFVIQEGMRNLSSLLKELEKVREGLRYSAILILIALIIFPNLMTLYRYQRSEGWQRLHRAHSLIYMPLVKWTSENVNEHQAISVSDVGYIGYYTEAVVIESTWGLTDEYIAHSNFPRTNLGVLFGDINYIILRAPEYVFCRFYRDRNNVLRGPSPMDETILNGENRDIFYQHYHQLEGVSVGSYIIYKRNDLD